jgi:hypothetical protein
LTLEERLRDIQAITDAALSHLDDRDSLAQLLARTRDILGADTHESHRRHRYQRSPSESRANRLSSARSAAASVPSSS